jgi:hypothetical protein
MIELRWEDPPPHGNTKPKPESKYDPIVDALRARPREWAVVYESTPGSAGAMTHRIKSGWGPFNPAGAFEAVCRKGVDKTVVYARYVGEVVPGRGEPC